MVDDWCGFVLYFAETRASVAVFMAQQLEQVAALVQPAGQRGERPLPMGVGTYASSCDRSAAQPNPPKNRNVGTKVGQTAG